MKKLIMTLVLITAANANGQNWGLPGGNTSRWIVIRDMQSDGNVVGSWFVIGGTSTNELDYKGFLSIGEGRQDYGYFEFWGDASSERPRDYVLDWPPSLITLGMVLPGRREVFYYANSIYQGFCNCDCVEATLDTLYPVDAFGFWWHDLDYPLYRLSSINSGSNISTSHMLAWQRQPCPPGAPWQPKNPILPLAFADSLYRPLPPGATISGDSPLFLRALTAPDVPSLDVKVYLQTNPDNYRILPMTEVSGGQWHARYDSCRALGLESYNTAVAVTIYPGMSTNYERAVVDLALTKLRTKVDNVLIDTVFMRSDSMKIAKDLQVSLHFYKDGSSQEVSAIGLVDSAGYKYKSRWISSANYNPKPYYRQFPSGTNYRWWNRITDNCQVTFNKDSLYAVGGLLTIEAKGALKLIIDENGDTLSVNKSFFVTTDTLKANGDTLQTKRILIDKDPANTLFIDSLQHDIVKAIGWVEYAGSYDTSHCDNPYNVRYNNYWDNRIAGGDTCRDTRLPCENTGSTAAGTMQMLRLYWAPVFDGTTTEPLGYTRCRWDSLEWNWKANVHNGKYILLKNLKTHMSSAQRTWDSLCVMCNPADSISEYPNKEDLWVYGYKEGATLMNAITAATWSERVKKHSYVKSVRRSKYDKPWQ